MLADQPVEQPVVPCARDLHDLVLELVEGHGGDLAVTDVHGEVELGDAALGERDVVVDRGPVEALEEQVLQPEPDVRVEGVARHRHEQRHAPAVRVAAREQADLLGLVDLQEAHHLLSQLVGRGREQLVLGEALEDRDDRLVVVRPLVQVLRVEDLLQLAVQQRRLTGRLRVRLRREQADHPGLADDAPLRRDLPDADVIHPRAPMDGRRPVRLRVDQQVTALDTRPQVRLDRVERHRLLVRRPVELREDPETRPGHGRERATLGQVDQLVLAIAEEDEVQVQQPLEEGNRLGHLVRRVQRRTGARDLDHVARRVLHRLEVADREPDVAQDAADRPLELRSVPAR